MSSVSTIETSFYPGLIEGFAPKTLYPVEPIKTDEQSNEFGYHSNDNYSNNENDIDLSNYYDSISSEDLLSQAGRNIIKSTQDLDNAMASAIQNGYGVNEACKIKQAEIAYKANAFVFNIAKEISTFEIKI